MTASDAGEKAVGTERELQQLIDNIPVQVATFGIDGNYLYVNKRSFAVTGFSAADLQGEHWKKLHHPDEIKSIEREWSACLASGEPLEREIRRHMADGSYRWYLIRRVPVRDKLGNVIRWYGSGLDIEDRKRVKEALRRSEALLAKGQEASQTGHILVLFSDGRIHLVRTTLSYLRVRAGSSPDI